VAIKTVNVQKLNKKLRDNLTSEIRILEELKHPHIVALIQCMQVPTHIHLIMEFCPLGDVSIFMRRRESHARSSALGETFRKYPNPPAGGLNEVIVRHLLKQLASAMEFLRIKNLIHRDIKPQNLLLNYSPMFYARAQPEEMPYTPVANSLIPVVGVESLPMLKIADFGFARSLPTTSLAETLCGSPLYMAPEILRYEKYDAKADLWSVGTVAFEMMVGRPPFKAGNHVELLRKIEMTKDNIEFPRDPRTSSGLKSLIRGLLKQSPVARMSFVDFFAHPVITDEIPGLVGEDRPRGIQSRESQSTAHDPEPMRRQKSQGAAESSRTAELRGPKDNFVQQRPSIGHVATAPAGQIHHAVPDRRQSLGVSPRTREAMATPISNQPARPPSSGRMSRKSSEDRPTSRQIQDAGREAKEVRERAAQDVAFERDYVVIEKKAVEVNAFADEIAANTISAGRQQELARRYTASGTPASSRSPGLNTGQPTQGRRPDHLRQPSDEKRKSTTSVISRALKLGTDRLYSFGISPTFGINRGGPSPPLYSAYPAHSAPQSSPLLLGSGGKTPGLNDDIKVARAASVYANRSDCVYHFAEVKYRQLVPLAPIEQGLGVLGVQTGQTSDVPRPVEEDDGLTPDAIVTLSEEALVLYVKALGLLQRAIDITQVWWDKKGRVSHVDESVGPRSYQSRSDQDTVRRARLELHNIVPWARDRFNDILGKAEIASLKLVEAQKKLPQDHLSHPSNRPFASISTPGMGTSRDNVVISPGVSAEKLLYTRACEMSRSAAVSELVMTDLPGCEMSYKTAIQMLEAVLETEEQEVPRRKQTTTEGESSADAQENQREFDPVEMEDREAVMKCKWPVA
jgi:serine/threonine-protein kinase ULK/ATG1